MNVAILAKTWVRRKETVDVFALLNAATAASKAQRSSL
jgi:hypothetical protein